MTNRKARPIVKSHATILEAMAVINSGGCHLAVVVDDDEKVVGIVTDGDVRRNIISGVDTAQPVMDITNTHPLIARRDNAPEHILALMEKNLLTALPVVDDENRLITVAMIHDFVHHGQTTFANAIIMAGGEGRRLRPFTEAMPKPMMSVGGKPLIEYTVSTLAKRGVGRIHVALNYLAENIRSHLGDGSAFGANLDYVQETTKLGTAGALTLLPKTDDGPILVMNGDILTDFDVNSMFVYHQSHGNDLTIGVVDYTMEIPYGVVKTDGGMVCSLEEKPSHSVHINAGIYAIEPKLLDLIPANTFYNMTDLIADALRHEHRIAPFLIHEHWIDIGTPKDLERAQALVADLGAQRG